VDVGKIVEGDFPCVYVPYIGEPAVDFNRLYAEPRRERARQMKRKNRALPSPKRHTLFTERLSPAGLFIQADAERSLGDHLMSQE
jgi:hypothetical protein